MLNHPFKILIVFCVLIIFITYVLQRNLIYFPSANIPQPQDYNAHDLQVLSLTTQDKLALNAWYKPAKANNPTVLFLHGNAGTIGDRMPTARVLINAGFGVLLPEYRGYGGNKGVPTEQGLYKDGRAALQFLINQRIKLSQLVLFGESLGTGVASQLATEQTICALVLQSPFTSLAAVARYHYPWIPLKPWDKYDSLSRIQSINTALLVLHGTDDKTVPYNEGVILFKAANSPKKMLTFSGYDHNNLIQAPDFYSQIIQFIHQHCR